MRLVCTWICGFLTALILCTQVLQPANEVSYPHFVEVERIVRVPVLIEPSQSVQREFYAVATAYTHTGDLTFMELPTDVGLIAVDPNVIPLGSLVWVEGYGYAIAADTGNRDYIGGLRIDVFKNTEAEAVEWGVRKVRVKLIR